MTTLKRFVKMVTFVFFAFFAMSSSVFLKGENDSSFRSGNLPITINGVTYAVADGTVVTGDSGDSFVGDGGGGGASGGNDCGSNGGSAGSGCNGS